MDNDLPDNFDIIVVGTGMTESIVAAAASRIGKRVLHVDSNDFYGGLWTSFSIEGIQNYIISPKVSTKLPAASTSVDIKDTEHSIPVGNKFFHISSVSHAWHIPREEGKDLKEVEKDLSELELQTDANKKEQETVEQRAESNSEIESVSKDDDSEWTQEKIMKNSRKFNLDLAPKLQFARGDFVELLISSNIARYSEYRSVSRVLTWLNGQLEIVPCSRSDVFSNTRVSVVEKRMLMKLLTTCMDEDESQFNEYQNKTFYTFLKDKKLTPNLIHYVLYAISMSNKTTPCLEGIESTKRFLNSLGRFGKTPFLFSMYGSGELPQAFCRLCAVFGGTYCLNRCVSSLIFEAGEKCVGVLCGNQRISADNFVMTVDAIPEQYAKSWKRRSISRAIFITERSILPCEKENLTLLLFPPENDKNAVTVIELGPATGTCPQGLYVVHMYCKQQEDPKVDLKHCVEKLLSFNQSKESAGDGKEALPNVLWSLYFTVTDTDETELKSGLPENIYACSGPDLDLDYDESVRKAKDIFMKIYPDCEFLPRAPDPEEIILCDDDQTKETENLPSEKEILDSENVNEEATSNEAENEETQTITSQ